MICTLISVCLLVFDEGFLGRDSDDATGLYSEILIVFGIKRDLRFN